MSQTLKKKLRYSSVVEILPSMLRTTWKRYFCIENLHAFFPYALKKSSDDENDYFTFAKTGLVFCSARVLRCGFEFFHLLLCVWVFYAYAKKYVFLCVCLCVFIHHVHALPSEARGGHLIPCIWSCELSVEAENKTQILWKSGQCS